MESLCVLELDMGIVGASLSYCRVCDRKDCDILQIFWYSRQRLICVNFNFYLNKDCYHSFATYQTFIFGLQHDVDVEKSASV